MTSCSLLLVLSGVLAVARCNSVFAGLTHEAGGARRVLDRRVDATALPLLRREQDVHFELPTPDQNIKGIAIKDLENGNAEAAITRGGLGFNFVDIKLRSERGSGLKYLIEVFG